MVKEKVLIVEDEKHIVELIRYNLSREGYYVDGVSSGEEPIKRVRSEIPDLFLLDLMLPGVDGLDVCRILRSDPKTQRIPIVMVTPKGGESDIAQAIQSAPGALSLSALVLYAMV